MSNFAIIELFTAAYLIFAGFVISVEGLLSVFMFRALPAVLAVLLVFDSVSRIVLANP